jgi:hypothetical protein
LILGIKGTMSVVELKILYMRMVAGIDQRQLEFPGNDN